MLIIFDCDGVLVDSEPPAAAVFSELLALHGIEMSPQICYSTFHGHTLDYCFSWVEQQFNCRLPADFNAQLEAATRRRFANELQPVPGIVNVLEFLKRRHIEFCVASNGEHRKINHSLAITGLDVYFAAAETQAPRRFSREDVQWGKPAPDLFLHAAEVVGVPARFCTVVEDSPSGFAAANAAGMRLLRFMPQNTEGASGCIQSMDELLDRLALNR